VDEDARRGVRRGSADGSQLERPARVIWDMDGEAVELVVRFASTVLAVTRVRRGERYVIGTAPEVDLPLEIAALTAFPLVDSTATGFVIRLPIGVSAGSRGIPIADREVALERGGRIDVAFGKVTIAIAHVDDVPVAVPRPPTALRRIAPFVIAALFAHVGIVMVAMWTADIDPITVPVVHATPPRVPTNTLPMKPPKPARPPEPKRGAKAVAAARSTPTMEAVAGAPEQVARAVESAQHAGFLGSASLDDLSMITGSKDLAKELSDVGPVYDEDAANAQSFGGSARKFDPTNDPAFDSVKTGRFATLGGGRGAGANYRLPAHGKFREVERPPIMGLTCDDGLCKTVGSLDRFTVRDYVEKRYVDMMTCFERHARSTSRIELTLRFDIGSDGKPNEVHADEASGFGGCVVRIVERVRFPTDQPTQVTYPIAFWRT